VLVSKLKPASDILALHSAPAAATTTDGAPPRPRAEHFGENYAQELQAKAAALPRTVKWHFIGALQTNKARALAATVPNLWCVSGVDSARKADLLDRGRREAADAEGAADGGGDEERRLRVKIQVNTSGEAQKGGVVGAADAAALARHVVERCPHLQLSGFMTIGALARSAAAAAADGGGEENADFRALADARDAVAEALGVPPAELELSMGMSADFEAAVRAGSDEVRVGSNIFGERPPRQAA
jgi:hypothetical protein